MDVIPSSTAQRMSRGRGEEGQALAIVVAVTFLLALIPSVLAFDAAQRSSSSQQHVDMQQAQLAVKAGVADFEARIAANSSYATEYCSNGYSSSWTCGVLTIPGLSANPAFGDEFDPDCQTSSSISTSTASKASYAWVMYSGRLSGGRNTEYQYVVDPSNAQSKGVTYLYTTGRVGTSGHYTCTTIKTAIGVQTSSTANPICGGPSVPTQIPTTSDFVQVTLSGGRGAGGGTGGGAGGPGTLIQADVPVPGGEWITYNLGCTGTSGNGSTPAAAAKGFAPGGVGGADAGNGGAASAIYILLDNAVSTQNLCQSPTATSAPSSPTTSTLQPCSTPSSLTGWENGTVRWNPVSASVPACVMAVAGGGGGGGEGGGAGGGNAGASAGVWPSSLSGGGNSYVGMTFLGGTAASVCEGGRRAGC